MDDTCYYSCQFFHTHIASFEDFPIQRIDVLETFQTKNIFVNVAESSHFMHSQTQNDTNNILDSWDLTLSNIDYIIKSISGK